MLYIGLKDPASLDPFRSELELEPLTERRFARAGQAVDDNQSGFQGICPSAMAMLYFGSPARYDL